MTTADKFAVFGASILVIIGLQGWAQTPPDSTIKYVARTEVEREILGAVQQLVGGVNEQNLEKIKSLYVSDADIHNFVDVFNSPYDYYTHLQKKVNLDQLLQNYWDQFDKKNNSSRFIEAFLFITEPNIQVEGDKAVLKGKAIIDHTTMSGSNDVYKPSITLEFQKIRGQWKIVKERYD